VDVFGIKVLAEEKVEKLEQEDSLQDFQMGYLTDL
jgi:hypothetical protein